MPEDEEVVEDGPIPEFSRARTTITQIDDDEDNEDDIEDVEEDVEEIFVSQLSYTKQNQSLMKLLSANRLG